MEALWEKSHDGGRRMTVATFQRMMDDYLIEDVLRSNSGTGQQEIKFHPVACTLSGLPDEQANTANKAQTTRKKSRVPWPFKVFNLRKARQVHPTTSDIA